MKAALGHLWYNSSTIMGSISAAPSGDSTSLLGSSGPAYPWTHATGSPHILTSSSVRTRTEWGPA
jgi:hypothetical protein